MAGILLGLLGHIAASIAWTLAGLGVLIGCVCHRRPQLAFAGLMLLWLSLGALRWTVWQRVPADDISRLVSVQAKPMAVRGTVTDDPAQLFDPNEPERQVALVRVMHVRTDGGWTAGSGRLRARLRGPHPLLRYGDEVLLEGRGSTVPGPTNPGQFDWRASLARRHVHALLAVQPHDGVVRWRARQGVGWMRGIVRLRHRLEALIDGYAGASHAGLLRSLLLGERVALDEELKRAFVETGTVHLLVISGFNVGLIAAILELCLRWLGVPFRPRLACSAVALTVYSLLTGAQPPVVRATGMAWIVLGALGLDRVVNWPNTLAAAALAMLWMSPAQLLDPGFQLSFGAVASLLVFTRGLQASIEPRLPVAWSWLRRYVALGLATTLAVWIGLWPLLAWYFHLVSPVSVIANLVLVPLVSVLVGAGTVILSAGLVLPPIVGWTMPVLRGLVDLTVLAVQMCHAVPWGSWPVGHPSWMVIAGYAVLVAVSSLRRPLRLTAGWLAACWLVGLNVWVWSLVGARAAESSSLEVTALDVGHGDSLVIRTPDHRVLLVDAGTSEAGRYVVLPYLRYRGYSTLDALVLTHPDEDHVGGAASVLRDVRVKRVITNGAEGSTKTARRVLELARERNVPLLRAYAGMRLTGLHGAEMMVLHPPAGFVPETAPASNDNSIVLRVARGQVSVLLCGDLEEQGVPWVMGWGRALRSTILKVPHHGSRLGPAQRAFFEQVHPEVAILSVGRLHHLPTTEVLSDLSAVGARPVLTRDAGTVTVRTDGLRYEVRTFTDGEF